jgi:hypothetical protein
MHANLMSWQDRRIGDGDSAVNSMTYNDQSRGDLHVIFKVVGFQSTIRKSDDRKITHSEARSCRCFCRSASV